MKIKYKTMDFCGMKINIKVSPCYGCITLDEKENMDCCPLGSDYKKRKKIKLLDKD